MFAFTKHKQEEEKEIEEEHVDNKKESIYILNSDEVVKIVIDDYILINPQLTLNFDKGIISKEEYIDKIKGFINITFRGKEINLDDVLKKLDDYLFGYYILQELIEDHDDISDIKCLDYDQIRIKTCGKRKTSSIKFKNREEYLRFINFIATKNQATLTEATAIQKFTDAKTSSKFILRINLTGAYINSSNIPYLTIRKVPKFKQGVNELKSIGMFNYDVAKYLIESMESGLTIGFTGQGASGKTRAMNALLDELPHSKSGLVIQEAEELFSNTHPDLMFQKVVENNGIDSKVKYSLRDLSINGLLTDIDFFCIGEIKGGEASDMVNATYTGAQGMFSVHGNGTREAMNKVVHYMKYSSDLKRSELMEMLTSIDIVVYMKNFKVMAITEIQGYGYEINNLIYQDIFKYEVNNGKPQYIKLNDRCEKVKSKMKLNNYLNQPVKEA